MKCIFKASFRKDFSKHKDPKLAKVILGVIDEIAAAEKLSDINSLKKLKNRKTAYRIRIGDYRIGLVIIDKTAIFAAFTHQ
jgi:mRNA interferase RelE/StbE